MTMIVLKGKALQINGSNGTTYGDCAAPPLTINLLCNQLVKSIEQRNCIDVECAVTMNAAAQPCVCRPTAGSCNGGAVDCWDGPYSTTAQPIYRNADDRFNSDHPRQETDRDGKGGTVLGLF
jgi:hypothetical protein